VAKNVENRPSHIQKGVNLTVKRLKATPPPPIVSRDLDEEKLFFSELPDGSDATSLTSFIAKHSRCEANRVTFSMLSDVAVVEFRGTPG